jgi:hypothetical protein
MPAYFECLDCKSVTLLVGAPVCKSCGHGTGLVLYRDDEKYAAKARLAGTLMPRHTDPGMDQPGQVPST